LILGEVRKGRDLGKIKHKIQQALIEVYNRESLSEFRNQSLSKQEKK